MKKSLKRFSALGAASAAVAALIVALPAASTAQASVACEGVEISINDSPGGDPMSTAFGHRHDSGNHYIQTVWDDGLVDWWADNDGGSDGDSADTYYASRRC